MANDYGYGSALDYPQYTGSGEVEWDPITFSVSKAGTVRGRMAQAAGKRRMQVVHKYLTTSQRNALRTFFFTTKRGTSFKFGWNWEETADQYTVYLNAPNGLQWQMNGPYWDVTVPLIEA